MTSATPIALTKIEKIVCQLFLLALFCVAFSTALTNVFVGLSYLGFIVAVCTSAPLRAVLASPRLLLPGLLALGLLALYVLGTTWTIAAPDDIGTALRKYSRLMILPIGIALAWRDPTLAARALAYCLAGTAVLVVSIYLTSMGLMPSSSLGWWRVSADRQDAYVFRNHVTIGFLLGFAASACLLLGTYARSTRLRVAAAGAALAAALPIMFLSQGRTGYVVLLVGLVGVFVLRVRLTPVRVAAGLALLALLFGGMYASSTNVKARTDAMVHEIATKEVQSPNGLRVSFIEVGLAVLRQHPLIGIGTGGFAQAYAPTAQRNWPASHEMATARHQPHSEFMLTAVQLGLLGCIVYFGMFVAMGRAALGPRTFERDMLALMLLIYVITSSFNSLLWDTTEAHWFLLLSGCLYVGARRVQAVAAAPAVLRESMRAGARA
jgi:O-antigen ligase